jgi:hypothetical protein
VVTRIHNKNAKILFYGPERETVLGLIIPGDVTEIDVNSVDIEFANDIKYSSGMLAGLKDAHGEFTGYYDKGDFHGTDSASPSGS